MKRKADMHLYVWIEFVIWFFILCIIIAAIRFHRYNERKELKTYQIFMQDVDGMIVGSPVKFMGVQVGYIQTIKIVSNDVYVKFVLTDKDLSIPKGSIASVEFSGLGGSKSLEIYPPTKQSEAANKFIIVDRPKRLHDSLGLLNEMFETIGAMGSKVSYFVREINLIKKDTKPIKLEAGNVNENIKTIDTWLDTCENNRKNFNNILKEWNKNE